jgi:hypothetical protein
MCKFNVALLCFEKHRSWGQKPQKNLANFTKGYHR